MWSEPHAGGWPGADGSRPPRPVLLFPPEPISGPKPDEATPPARFRWRRRDLETRVALGPERILPEWWFDHPEWRNGPRDYWRVETTAGERLWLYFAHGGDIPGGWYAQGRFD
jgi:protein ImuB